MPISAVLAVLSNELSRSTTPSPELDALLEQLHADAVAAEGEPAAGDTE